MSSDSGKSDAREIGIVIGKLESILRSQTNTETKIDSIVSKISTIETSISLVKQKQEDQEERLDSAEEKLGEHSRDITRSKSSWKMVIAKWGASGGIGATLIMALLKFLGIVKLGGAE